jgi:hypothetical protein
LVGKHQVEDEIVPHYRLASVLELEDDLTEAHIILNLALELLLDGIIHVEAT